MYFYVESLFFFVELNYLSVWTSSKQEWYRCYNFIGEDFKADSMRISEVAINFLDQCWTKLGLRRNV